jgi:hypothetical protein
MMLDTYFPADNGHRRVVEWDKSDHATILWAYAEIIDLHRRLAKPEPPLEEIASFCQPQRTTWLVDDVGLVFADRDLPWRASVHIVFWDGRLRGRETLCRGLADYAIHRWDLSYICTNIPKTSRATLAFAKRVGFEVAQMDPDGMIHLAYTTEVVSP